MSDLATLLAAARKGDNKAFSNLCVALLPDLTAFAHSITLSSADADDAVQDTMLHLVDVFHDRDFPTVGNLFGYLRTVVHRRVVDRYREGVRRREQSLPDDARTEDPPPDTGFDLQALLTILPPREGEVVRRVFVQGQTTNQAASEMGIAPGSVRKALARALAKLKPYLEE